MRLFNRVVPCTDTSCTRPPVIEWLSMELSGLPAFVKYLFSFLPGIQTVENYFSMCKSLVAWILGRDWGRLKRKKV